MRNTTVSRSPSRGYAVAAGTLGWALDAFDFFVVVFMVDALAAHFQVAKSGNGKGGTTSSVTPLDRSSRIEEVARMLGGIEITATTRKHAKEMLTA